MHFVFVIVIVVQLELPQIEAQVLLAWQPQAD
jgi:hypothetical protein